MDLITPFVLSAVLTGADYGSTHRALGRGGVEVGPVASHSLRAGAAVRFVGYAALDLGVQKASRGKKWPVWVLRGLATGATVYVVRQNERKARP